MSRASGLVCYDVSGGFNLALYSAKWIIRAD